MNAATNDRNTALILAAQHGHVGCLQLLLDAKADMHVQRGDGHSALAIAVAKDLTVIIPLRLEALLGATATVDKKNKQGKTPLMVAAYHSSHGAVKKLISAKANVNSCDERGDTALILAARHGSTSIVKTLLSAKVNVKARDKQGKIALYWAL